MKKQRSRRHHPAESGFTLIELLVVIAVLSILAAVVALNITGVNQRATSAGCKADLRTVQVASDGYHGDIGGYAGSMSELYPNYLHSVPTSLGEVSINADGHGTVTSSAC